MPLIAATHAECRIIFVFIFAVKIQRHALDGVLSSALLLKGELDRYHLSDRATTMIAQGPVRACASVSFCDGHTGALENRAACI